MNEWLAQLNSAPILLAAAQPPAETHAQTAATATAGEGESGGEHALSPWVFYGFAMFAALVLLVLSILATRRMRLIPRGLQNVMEYLVEGVFSIPETVMGARGRQYAPFVSTFFLYILAMNLTGLIPVLKSGTASLSITFGLAIVAFIGVQYYGFRAHGVRYLAHFLGPVPAMAFLILPLELISELIRPVSLSIRLYGNIFGEEQVVAALAGRMSPVVAVLMLPLQLLTSVLQAYVFTLLVTVYISLATEKHEEGHEESAEAPAH